MNFPNDKLGRDEPSKNSSSFTKGFFNTYFPTIPDAIKSLREGNEPIHPPEKESSLLKPEKENGLLKIEPLTNCPDEAMDGFEFYIKSVERLVKRILPTKLLQLAEINQSEDFFNGIANETPLISWTEKVAEPPCSLAIATLCSADNTFGVGRFLGDVYSRWLVPGKQLALSYVHSLAFRFSQDPKRRYFLHELFVKIENKKDVALILTHLPNLAQEIKLNILAVQHARKVISLKPLTLEQKRIIIQENITSLLNRPSKDVDNNIFDQMQHLFIKINAEEKVTRIQEQIAPLLEFRPQVFERDVFTELQNFVVLFKDQFSANRDLKHLTRLVAQKYLFRKIVTHAVNENPQKRHMSLKISTVKIKLKNETKKVLSVLIGINLLHENEIIGEKHVFSAIQSILQNVEKVPDSIIVDRRNNSNVRLIYFEIMKRTGAFTADEIKELRSRLAREVQARVESVINPIFMPRNEEEVMRNILILSHELKYIQDIPQVIITFHKQAEDTLSFTAILLRVIKPEDEPLSKLFSKYKGKVRFSDHEIKTVGHIRKKYPKEAIVFEIHVDKKDFLRKDFSVDLNEARKFVYKTLSELFGEIRDYNGGMIAKQNEALTDLKKLLLQINIRSDFLLENFFYSLSPKYMQSILQPALLKKVFLLTLEATEHDYTNQIYFIKTQIIEDHFVVTLASSNSTFKDFIMNRVEVLEFEPSTLTFSYIKTYDICCLSYILKFADSDQHQQFLQLIIESIKIWKETVKKTISPNFFPAL